MVSVEGKVFRRGAGKYPDYFMLQTFDYCLLRVVKDKRRVNYPVGTHLQICGLVLDSKTIYLGDVTKKNAFLS